MPHHEPAIEAVGLSKTFAGRAVLAGIDLAIAAGESVALAGANGAGKTTLLRCLASALRPSAGEVHWFGRPARAGVATRRLIGMVAHESRLYPQLTLRENLVFAGRMCDLRDPGRKADELLRSTGMAAHAERLPSRVSRGMRQRISVARALVHDPPVLLLDEPFSGLDAEAADWLVALLGDLRAAGRTLCFVTHDVALRNRLADRIVMLRSGRIASEDAVTFARAA